MPPHRLPLGGGGAGSAPGWGGKPRHPQLRGSAALVGSSRGWGCEGGCCRPALVSPKAKQGWGGGRRRRDHGGVLGGGPTRLGPAGLLQESRCSRVGLQNGAQEAAEEEEEAGRAFGLSELGRAQSETSLWNLSTLPHPKGVERGEPPLTLKQRLQTSSLSLSLSLSVKSTSTQGCLLLKRRGAGSHCQRSFSDCTATPGTPEWHRAALSPHPCPGGSFPAQGEQGTGAPVPCPRPGLEGTEQSGDTHLLSLQQPAQDELVQDVLALMVEGLAGLAERRRGW